MKFTIFDQVTCPQYFICADYNIMFVTSVKDLLFIIDSLLQFDQQIVSSNF